MAALVPRPPAGCCCHQVDAFEAANVGAHSSMLSQPAEQLRNHGTVIKRPTAMAAPQLNAGHCHDGTTT